MGAFLGLREGMIGNSFAKANQFPYENQVNTITGPAMRTVQKHIQASDIAMYKTDRLECGNDLRNIISAHQEIDIRRVADGPRVDE